VKLPRANTAVSTVATASAASGPTPVTGAFATGACAQAASAKHISKGAKVRKCMANE